MSETRYSVFEDVLRGDSGRVVVIVSDDEGKTWRPYTPVFPSQQKEVAYIVAEAMNARAQSEDAEGLRLQLGTNG
jgi:hypothetical protein